MIPHFQREHKNNHRFLPNTCSITCSKLARSSHHHVKDGWVRVKVGYATAASNLCMLDEAVTILGRLLFHCLSLSLSLLHLDVTLGFIFLLNPPPNMASSTVPSAGENKLACMLPLKTQLAVLLFFLFRTHTRLFICHMPFVTAILHTV